MKMDSLKWCVDKVGLAAPDTNDTEAAQKALAASTELARAQDVLAAMTDAIVSAMHAPSDEVYTTGGRRMRIWLKPEEAKALLDAAHAAGVVP